MELEVARSPKIQNCVGITELGDYSGSLIGTILGGITGFGDRNTVGLALGETYVASLGSSDGR